MEKRLRELKKGLKKGAVDGKEKMQKNKEGREKKKGKIMKREELKEIKEGFKNKVGGENEESQKKKKKGQLKKTLSKRG